MQLIAMYLQDKFSYTVIEATFYTGRVLILMGVATFIVQFFIIRKISPTPGFLLRIGSIFSILALVAFIFSTNLYYMSFALAFYGLGGALMGPGLFTGVSLGVDKGEQGAAAEHGEDVVTVRGLEVPRPPTVGCGDICLGDPVNERP